MLMSRCRNELEQKTPHQNIDCVGDSDGIGQKIISFALGATVNIIEFCRAVSEFNTECITLLPLNTTEDTNPSVKERTLFEEHLSATHMLCCICHKSQT